MTPGRRVALAIGVPAASRSSAGPPSASSPRSAGAASPSAPLSRSAAGRSPRTQRRHQAGGSRWRSATARLTGNAATASSARRSRRSALARRVLRLQLRPPVGNCGLDATLNVPAGPPPRSRPAAATPGLRTTQRHDVIGGGDVTADPAAGDLTLIPDGQDINGTRHSQPAFMAAMAAVTSGSSLPRRPGNIDITSDGGKITTSSWAPPSTT